MESKKRNIKMIGIGLLLLFVIGATYSYFAAGSVESKTRDVRVLTSTVDSVFEIGKELSITANQENFASGKGNRSDSTTAKAILKANNYTNTATDHYYLYLDITSNSLKYTTTEKTAELILTVSRTDGTEVNISGLTPVTVNGVTGYDITEARGTIKIADNYAISATNANNDNSKIDEWNITVTLVNLDSNQNDNAGALFKGTLRMRKEAPAQSVLKASTGGYENPTLGIKAEEIVSRVVFENGKVEHPEAASEYDFSEAGDGSIKGYTVLNADGEYTLYINSENKIMANPNSSYWFTAINGLENAQYITSIEGLENIDTSNVTTMNSMFYECSGLTKLDLNGWDTSKVTKMAVMFFNCYNLAELNISDWDTSNVTTMNSMFYECSGLTKLDLNGWDTSKVTNMSNMFFNCSGLTNLNLNGWDTSSVTNMRYMFASCNSLTTLNISNWDTSSVTTMQQMFYDCSSLTTLNISNWDTSSVTTMNSMFYDCSSLTTLNISNWDTSSVTDMFDMFMNCDSLTALNISNWNTSKVTNMSGMFANCSSLTKLIVRNNSEKEKFIPLVESSVSVETV